MKRRVLLIDDDDIAREFLASLLRDGGYEVFELPSPIGATRTILNERIEILVLDVFMPDMDGDKLIKILRDNPRLGNLSIVLVSSCNAEELASVAARVKADDVVPKSEARARLLSAVAKTRSRPGKHP